MKRFLSFFVLAAAACGASAPPPVAPVVAVAASSKPAAPGVCAGAVSIARSLRQPMRIEVFVTRGIPKLDAYVRKVEKLLEDLATASDHKLTVVVTDAKIDAAARARAQEGGLEEAVFGEADDQDRATLTQGFLGMLIAYGEKHDKIPRFAPQDDRVLEWTVATKLRDVRDSVDDIHHDIGVIDGYGATHLGDPDLVPAFTGSTTPTVMTVTTEYFPTMRIHVVDASKPIDPSLDGLIVLQPSRDIPEADLRRIDAFVMLGKTLFVAASAVDVAPGDSQMIPHVGSHGLAKLLGGYGIDLHDDALLDFGNPWKLQVSGAGGIQNARFPPIIVAEENEGELVAEAPLDRTFVPLVRLPLVAFSFASSVTVRADRQPAAKLRVVARTSSKTTVDSDAGTGLGLFRQYRPRGPFSQLAIGAVAEGKLRSAFGSGDSARPARVAVLASASLFGNPFVRVHDELDDQIATAYATRFATNSLFMFKNTLDWITVDDALRACAPDAR